MIPCLCTAGQIPKADIQEMNQSLTSYLKTGESSQLETQIDTSSQDYPAILRAWELTHNWIGYEDTNRIALDPFILTADHEDIFVSFIPYLRDAQPTERVYELFCPVYQLQRQGTSLLMTDMIFPSQLIDMIDINIDATLIPAQERIKAHCTSVFKLNHHIQPIILFNLYPDLTIENIMLNSKEIDYDYHRYYLKLFIPPELQHADRYKLQIDYSGKINDQASFYIRKDGVQLCFDPWFPFASSDVEFALGDPGKQKPDPFSHTFKLTYPDEYYSLSNYGNCLESNNHNDKRVDVWQSKKAYLFGILLGKWDKFTINPIGNIKPVLYLDKETGIDRPELIETASNLISFYTDRFGEPPTKAFYIVESPVYWNCDNYISSNTAIMDHEMAHFWWLSWPLNWFFHSLTEYSRLLYQLDRLGEDNFKKRVIEYWSDYYYYLGSNPKTVLKRDNGLVYNLGTMMMYQFHQQIGDERFFALCRNLTELPYDRYTFDHGELLQEINKVAGRDYEAFFDKWIDQPVELDDNPYILDENSAQLHAVYQLGRKEQTLYREKNWHALAALCDTIISKKNDYKMFWFRKKGNFFLKSHQYERALKAFQTSVRQFDPELNRPDRIFHSHLRWAQTLDLLGEREQALVQYNTILNSPLASPSARSAALRFLETPFVKNDIEKEIK